MIIAVASGKGGTGKTTVATSLALALSPQIPLWFLDLDVETPNAHLLLKPAINQRIQATLPVPEVDEKACQHCGICAQVCQYNAIAVVGEVVLVFPELCHGCGSCLLNCPEQAIHEVPRVLGVLESGSVGERLRFARGILDVGQPMAVPVIRQLKQWVQPDSQDCVIIDAPPGTSCSVVEAVRGADYVLLVTEPTPFGLHDLRLAYQLTKELGLSAGVIINRDGMGDSGVERFCASNDLPVLLRIPLDRSIAAGLAQGIPLVTSRPDYAVLLRQVFDRIRHQLAEPV